MMPKLHYRIPIKFHRFGTFILNGDDFYYVSANLQIVTEKPKLSDSRSIIEVIDNEEFLEIIENWDRVKKEMKDKQKEPSE